MLYNSGGNGMVKKLLLITLSIVAFKAYSGPGLRVCKMSVDAAAKYAAAQVSKQTMTRQLPALSPAKTLNPANTSGGLQALFFRLRTPKSQ